MTGASLRYDAAIDRVGDAIGAMLAAKIDLFVERTILAGATAAPSNHRKESIKALSTLGLPAVPVVVGLVCRPDFLPRVRAAVDAETSKVGDQNALPFSGIPLYEKAGQRSDCLAFYDRAKLSDYLAGKFTPDTETIPEHDQHQTQHRCR